MATGPRYRVLMRRRREIRTDYYQRLCLLKSDEPYLVTRVNNKHVRAQLITPSPQGDEAHAAATSADLSEYGQGAPTGNLPSAYPTGYLAGKRALAADVERAVPDTGLNTAISGNRIFVVQEGVIDANLEIPHNDAVPADWDHSHGVHIAKYAEQLDRPFYDGEFDAMNLPDHFDEVFGNLQEDE